MRVLFLDVATRCGWAYDGPKPGVPLTGVIISPRAVGDAEGGWAFGRVFASFQRRLVRLIEDAQPAIIGFEAPLQSLIGHKGGGQIRGNQNTARLLITFCGLVEMVADDYSIECSQTNLMTIKKYFAGHGRAEKADMIRMCRTLGWEVGGDDNRADAAAGWAHLKSLREPTFAPQTTPLFGRRAP